MEHDDERANDASPTPDLASLSVAELIAAALGEAEEESDDDGAGWKLVVELQRRGDTETLAAAERLTRSTASRERILGAQVLSQIGYAYPDREPFAGVRVRAVARLLEMLHSDRDPEVVRTAISGLGSLSALATLDDVVGFASHPDAEMRLAVAMAFPGLTGWQSSLAELDSTDAARVVATLVSLSEDEDGDVRNWALFPLARQYELDTPELRDVFVRHLADPDDDARAEAIVGLARRRDERALPALLTALRNETATETTIEAAAHLGDERLLPGLEELAQAGWDDNSTLDAAIRNGDPQARARWEAIGTTLAATLSAELETHLGDTAFVVEVGREPLEWFSRLTGTWTLANGTETTLFYDLDALVDERLAGDLEGAAKVFRQDIVEAEG